ncbi:MAG: PAS domain S-box protein [Gemmatimonadetes bacterium]|nr:PAS domain S-box protein [Gemmatimonadota bacterium]
MTTALSAHTPDDAGLRSLAESAGDLLSCHAPDGVYRYASPAAARLLGYEPAELVGRPVFDLFHPDELGLAQQGPATARYSTAWPWAWWCMRRMPASCSPTGRRASCSARARGQLRGLTSFNPYWLLLGEDERPVPPSDHPAMVALQTARPVWDRVVG